MDNRELGQKEEKFLFNMNIFDDDAPEEDDEEDIPPPPVFSEAELEAAKKSAYQQGKQDGIAETTNSAQQQALQVLENVIQNIVTLNESENAREALYEQESIRLSLSIFKKLFPLYHEKFGSDELKESISNILQNNALNKDIQIFVSPQIINEIEAYVSLIKEETGSASLIVKPDENLAPADCKITWPDGGALKSADTLAQEIETLMTEILAAHTTNRHDNEAEPQNVEQMQKNERHEEDNNQKSDKKTVAETPDE